MEIRYSMNSWKMNENFILEYEIPLDICDALIEYHKNNKYQKRHTEGRWKLEPSWLGCNSLLELYKKCGAPPSHRATVPVLISPGPRDKHKPKILGNESSQLIEVLNKMTSKSQIDLFPKELDHEISFWGKLLQNNVNDGVYRCGFAFLPEETGCLQMMNS